MDEAVFTCGQVSPKIWYTPQSRPVFLPKKKIGFKAIAVAAAINRQGEVVAYHIQDHSIDTQAFMEFLRRMKEHIGRKKQSCYLIILEYTELKMQQNLPKPWE